MSTTEPEVTYVVEVLCFDCARFYTAELAGWDQETWAEYRDQPDVLKALHKALGHPPCPCCGKGGSITSLGHLEPCRHLLIADMVHSPEYPGHFTQLTDPSPFRREPQ